jgi:hypothetical protein
LLKADKSDKKDLLHEDTRKRARPDGEVKHDVILLPWWKIIIQKNVAIIIQNLDFFLSLTTCLTLVKKKLKIKKIKELLKVKLV